MTSFEITTSSTPSRLGRSNIVSSRIPSLIERSPRAPVLRSIAFREIAASASSARVRSTLSISNSRWYCLTSAFFGSVRMRLSAASSRSSSVATTGSRPTNSGISPYLSRSSGSTWRKISPVLRSSGAITLAEKPIEAERPRAEMIFSNPEKAPPHTNKMLVVSTCRNSCWGCLRPPCGGTEAMVPSMIIRSGGSTYSPETQRQKRLAGAGRSDQQDVGFRQLDVVVLGLVVEPLVMVVDCDREHLLGVVLADDVVVEDLADLLRGRNAVARFHQRGLVLLADDVHAQLDALVADEYRRAGDQLAHFVLALAAERAIERILGIAGADLAHPWSPSRGE